MVRESAPDHGAASAGDLAAESARLLLSRIEDASMRVSSVTYEPTLVIRQSA